MITETITIQIEAKDRISLIQKTSDLKAISKLDDDEVQKLGLMVNSSKGRQRIKNDWGMIKSLCGIKD